MQTQDKMASPLSAPLKIGPYTLSHRIVMAPVTRFRNDENHVPTSLMTEYIPLSPCFQRHQVL
jgi:2,4-dienoyl-CoA reductase-like NADH-dependent reductase (Old Yellow Enzyme family)